MDTYICKITWVLRGYVRAQNTCVTDPAVIVCATEKCATKTLQHYFRPGRLWPQKLEDTLDGWILRMSPKFCDHLIWVQREFRGITLMAFEDSGNAKFLFYMEDDIWIGSNIENVTLTELERFAAAGIYVLRVTE